MTIHVPGRVRRRRARSSARRGAAIQKGMQYPSKDRVIIMYELPFNEVLFDFHDKLKSVTRATPRWTTSSSATAPTTW